MTIHTFDHSYAGLSASETQSSSCHNISPPRRSSGHLFINETGNRHLKISTSKRYRESWQRTAENHGSGETIVVDLHGHSSARMFAYDRENPNFNLNEVIL
jgi:hypothetical protein